MLVCVASAKGSPGVSTAALAMALAWLSPVLLAELDPAGGDLRPRIMPSLTGSHQLLNLASADTLTSKDVAAQVVSLDPPGHTKVVLPGLSDPTTAGALSQTWPDLAEVLCGFQLREGQPSLDVVADCGRLGVETPQPVLARADAVLVLLRARLDSVAVTAPVIARLKKSCAAPVLPVLVQDGPYGARDIERTLGQRCARLPYDPAGAGALESGRWGRRLDRSALLRGVRALVGDLVQAHTRTGGEDLVALEARRG
ncbi:hypothetical protein [Nocardiopsis sp. CNT312]|uniref:hypothetical protein n=1 Tax=Nocardiopsis sp. CNT312 TaxID=1137268 RepID=UPI0004ACC899|nr:hypothetical protein [Nocardiopsis sp. CNT312]